MKYILQPFLIIIFFFSCNKDLINDDQVGYDSELWPFKVFDLDQNGNITFSEINITDFQPSNECAICHQEHYDEWKLSSHSRSTKDPIFSIQKEKSEIKRCQHWIE